MSFEFSNFKMSKLYFPLVHQKDQGVYVMGIAEGPGHATLKQVLEKIGHTSIGIYRNGDCFYFADKSLDLTLEQLRREEILVVKKDPA